LYEIESAQRVVVDYPFRKLF